MQFQTLKEFLVLAETLNFLSAAEELYISQATLSKHIKELERELGAPLFKRTTRKVDLTDLGMRLVPYARQSVALQEKIAQEAADYLDRLNNYLVIGCVAHWDVMDLSKLTIEFQQAHPGIHITVITDESEELLELLHSEGCNFAIVRESATPPQDGLGRVRICEDPLFAFLPKEHPLAKSKSLSLRQLKEESFLMGADGGLSYQLGISACKEAGFHPNVIYRGGRPQTFNYLINGLGVGLMFGNPMAQTEAEAVVMVPLEPAVNANINLVYVPENLTEAGKTFLKFIEGYSFS
jgi:DNA-binding transcriptional LysR family regulator